MTTEQSATRPLFDLARSALGLSWSLALLGADATNRLLRGAGADGSVVGGLDAVRHAAEGQLGESFRRFLHAGDRVQRGAFDTVADLSRRPLFDPARAFEVLLGRSGEASADAEPATGDPSAGAPSGN